MSRVRVQVEGRGSVKETNVKSKPRVGSTEKDFEVLELTKVGREISPAGFGGLNALDKKIWVNVGRVVVQDILDVVGGLVDVAFNIHGETGGFWDSQTEVESDNSGDATETDEETPHEVDAVEVCYVSFFEKSALVGRGDDEGDQGGSYQSGLEWQILAEKEALTKVTPTLGSKDRGHHATTDFCGCKLR